MCKCLRTPAVGRTPARKTGARHLNYPSPGPLSRPPLSRSHTDGGHTDGEEVHIRTTAKMGAKGTSTPLCNPLFPSLSLSIMSPLYTPCYPSLYPSLGPTHIILLQMGQPRDQRRTFRLSAGEQHHESNQWLIVGGPSRAVPARSVCELLLSTPCRPAVCALPQA